MAESILKVENVYKEYRLGAIGGATLKGDLQSWMAKVRHKEDPNLKIGQEAYTKNEKFMALSDVSFEIKQGEALGIIGKNGAGKSTLLKLITRVTAPTKGKICINGRIASMLEVGTGFHPELTGRENIYLNGAILGMTKSEIDKHFDEIVEFSEISKFIDTPVKRYSSGMYVKLAFSVASHLESEIMIMDEVLAVGDAAFQNKCIDQMVKNVNSGRTILYVSHNMSTINRLCSRVMVLSSGEKIYDGDPAGGVAQYLDMKENFLTSRDLRNVERYLRPANDVRLTQIEFLDNKSSYQRGEKICLRFKYESMRHIDGEKALMLRLHLFTTSGNALGIFFPEKAVIEKQKGEIILEVDTSYLTPDKYRVDTVLYTTNNLGYQNVYDTIQNCFNFEINETSVMELPIMLRDWGSVVFPHTKVINK